MAFFSRLSDNLNTVMMRITLLKLSRTALPLSYLLHSTQSGFLQTKCKTYTTLNPSRPQEDNLKRMCNLLLSARLAEQKRATKSDDDDEETIKKISKIFKSCKPNTDITKELEKSKIKVTQKQTVEILKRFEHSGIRGYRFFQWTQIQEGYENEVEAYHCVITCLGRLRNFDLAWQVFDEMSTKKILTKKPFFILMRWYAKARKVESALETFHKMEKTLGFEAGIDDFNDFLLTLCKSDCTEFAHQVFEKMTAPDERFVPDAKSYTILIEAWGKEQNWRRFDALFHDMLGNGIVPNVVAYVVYMHALCRVNCVEEAADTLEDMRYMKCPPNAYAYGVLIHAYCARGKVSRAMEVYRKMKLDGCTPDAPIYNSLIKGLCAVSEEGLAHQVLQMMADEGIGPNARTYNIILLYLVHKGVIKDACDVFLKMTEQGCTPDSVTYTLMLKMLGNSDRVDMALFVWDYMHEQGACPTEEHYFVTINGLLKNERVDKACDFLEEMLDKGIVARDSTYSKVMEKLITSEKEDIARNLSVKFARNYKIFKRQWS